MGLGLGSTTLFIFYIVNIEWHGIYKSYRVTCDQLTVLYFY
jgi:hypothetical protein